MPTLTHKLPRPTSVAEFSSTGKLAADIERLVNSHAQVDVLAYRFAIDPHFAVIQCLPVLDVGPGFDRDLVLGFLRQRPVVQEPVAKDLMLEIVSTVEKRSPELLALADRAVESMRSRSGEDVDAWAHDLAKEVAGAID